MALGPYPRTEEYSSVRGYYAKGLTLGCRGILNEYNERIDRRHAHSVALAAFFRYGEQVLGEEWKTAIIQVFRRTASASS